MRIVVALGGNALGNNLHEQMIAAKNTAKAIVDLIEQGHELIISHGNGPQVGMIQNATAALTKTDAKYPEVPLSVCVAMSQSYIGYDLQNAIREELLNRGINKPVACIVSQVVVDKNDPAFQKPTKPIGQFMSETEAKALAEKEGYTVVEDSGRGWRRVVASPKPAGIVEIETIRALSKAGQTVIACGGGGIPVMKTGNGLKGAAAVIDKDFASCLLAQELDADFLIVLTAVEKVAVHFGKPDQKWLDEMTTTQAKEYCEQGEFAPGSMLPKVQAGIAFAESKKGRTTLITLLEKAKEGIEGKTGTIIKKA